MPLISNRYRPDFNICILQTVLWVIKSRKRDKIWLRETLPADFALKLNLRRGFNGTVKRYRPPSCYVSCFHSFSRYVLVYCWGPRRDWLVPKPVPSPQPVYRRFPIGLGPLWFKTGFVGRVYALLRHARAGEAGAPPFDAFRPAETDRKAEPMRFSRFRRCLWFGWIRIHVHNNQESTKHCQNMFAVTVCFVRWLTSLALLPWWIISFRRQSI